MQKSTSGSPHTLRKKRPAPKPPGPVAETTPVTFTETPVVDRDDLKSPETTTAHQEITHSTPLKINQSSTSSPEDNDFAISQSAILATVSPDTDPLEASTQTVRRVIQVDDELLEEEFREEEGLRSLQGESVSLRRVIKPLTDDDSTPIKVTEDQELRASSRQWEKVKENKESENRNRQSLISNSSDQMVVVGGGGEMDRFYNKSAQGKWKRRKGPAPSLPVPPKRVLQMLPIQDIRHELEVIEVQQQGLEKQGVQLEKMIREKTEGIAGEELNMSLTVANKNTSEVEALIMQLFDLVVEKNELFRRQAELMYLRRQHRLEVEQADLEYEIRVLMAQPECNKTDSDKAKEETLINRLMEVVRQRNAVVDSLEMDRLREAQEDLVSGEDP